MQIFYINIGGGEPMIRRDFFELIEHAVDQHVGVKFSTNGTRIDEAAARRLASIDYLDIQISIDGVDAVTSDRIRGAGSYDAARRAMDNLKAADFGQFKISVVMTRESVEQLDEFERSRRALRRRTATHPTSPLGPWRRHLAGTAPHARAESSTLSMAPRAPERFDRRLVLPPLGAR